MYKWLAYSNIIVVVVEAVVVVVLVVDKCHYLPAKFGGGGALKWTSVSTSPAKFGGGGSDTFSQVSRAVTLAIHRPDGFAAGKKSYCNLQRFKSNLTLPFNQMSKSL